MTAGMRPPKANCQAYWADVILRLLSPSWVLGCAEGEAVAQDHKQRSLFSFEDDAPQKDQGVGCPSPGPGARIANQGGFARSIKQTQRSRFCFRRE